VSETPGNDCGAGCTAATAYDQSARGLLPPEKGARTCGQESADYQLHVRLTAYGAVDSIRGNLEQQVRMTTLHLLIRAAIYCSTLTTDIEIAL